MKTRKCVVIGDQNVGKTSLIISYTTNSFPTKFESIVFQDYSSNIFFEDELYTISLWDTSSKDQHKILRPLCYPQTDIFLICFSLVNPETLENIEKNWLPEIKKDYLNCPLILVGTKLDLRNDFELHKEEFLAKGMKPISTIEGETFCQKIGGKSYIECSSLKLFNLTEVFEEAIKNSLK